MSNTITQIPCNAVRNTYISSLCVFHTLVFLSIYLIDLKCELDNQWQHCTIAIREIGMKKIDCPLHTAFSQDNFNLYANVEITTNPISKLCYYVACPLICRSVKIVCCWDVDRAFICSRSPFREIFLIL